MTINRYKPDYAHHRMVPASDGGYVSHAEHQDLENRHKALGLELVQALKLVEEHRSQLQRVNQRAKRYRDQAQRQSPHPKESPCTPSSLCAPSSLSAPSHSH